jgi:hypothetical protein
MSQMSLQSRFVPGLPIPATLFFLLMEKCTLSVLFRGKSSLVEQLIFRLSCQVSSFML